MTTAVAMEVAPNPMTDLKIILAAVLATTADAMEVAALTNQKI